MVKNKNPATGYKLMLFKAQVLKSRRKLGESVTKKTISWGLWQVKPTIFTSAYSKDGFGKKKIRRNIHCKLYIFHKNLFKNSVYDGHENEAHISEEVLQKKNCWFLRKINFDVYQL